MKSKLIILGCGSSVGSPRIDGYWGLCDKNEKKNVRTRCSALVVRGSNNILIDTSPDLKYQLIANKVKNISSVLFTHEHADQTNGLFELRPFYWINKKKINIYGNKKTINLLKKRNNYLFNSTASYQPIIKSNIIKSKITLGKTKEKITFEPISLKHGYTKSLGYIFEKTAYLSDCKDLSILNNKKLRNLNFLIIDALKYSNHYSHFSVDDAILIHKRLKPKRTVLTNMHYDLDYKYLVNKLPKNIVPAYDGLIINL